MAEHGVDQWKSISEKMDLKNRREAIIEFLRIKIGADTVEDQASKDAAEQLEKDFLFQLG